MTALHPCDMIAPRQWLDHGVHMLFMAVTYQQSHSLGVADRCLHKKSSASQVGHRAFDHGRTSSGKLTHIGIVGATKVRV
jgi:hypothetical protein